MLLRYFQVEHHAAIRSRRRHLALVEPHADDDTGRDGEYEPAPDAA